MPELRHDRRWAGLGCALFLRRLMCWLFLLGGWFLVAEGSVGAAAAANLDGFPASFAVQRYVVHASLSLPTNTLATIFSRHTGAQVDLKEVVSAAQDLQAAYLNQGYLPVSVAVAPGHADGVITLNVFQAVDTQIIVSGKRYDVNGDNGAGTNSALAAGVTNQVVPPPVIRRSSKPATPEEIAEARVALAREMASLEAAEKDKRIHVVSTNAGPRFTVEKYLVMGNSVLAPGTIGATLTNIDGAYGTNVSFDGIRTVVTELQKDYRERGYVTVAVALPQQKLTNATVKVQVTEGRLATIEIKGNHYFSSNNVMRALPSLHTNTVLNGLIFQSELNRANANRDRQIYPVIGPGPDPGTSDLTLKVKDQLPFHAKEEFNNESSPGTPDLRLNTSAVYDNLWQQEHSLGVQYSFSPQEFKTGNQWNFYDQPLVANYSTFYRLPLGNPEPVEKIIADNPNNFGYDEATRKFNLPSSSGQPDLTLYASRSTIDTGVATLSNTTLASTTNGTLIEQVEQQDLTVNNDVGFRFNLPLKTTTDFQSSISGGLDFKDYSLDSFKTNLFFVRGIETDQATAQTILSTNVSSLITVVPATYNHVEYLPLALRYDGTSRDDWGTLAFGLGLSANLWYDSSTTFPDSSSTNNTYGLKSLQSITGSKESTGHWVILTPTMTRVINLYTNWPLTIRADGQWASEPLISNEQFGIGGVNSVRGYQEGAAFGDTGWHLSLEQQTSPYTVGLVHGDVPLVVRGSVYMDYARAFLLDPQGRPDATTLWGTGFGGVASIGPHWQARLLFSLPLRAAIGTQQYQPFFNFALTAQF